MNMNGRLKAPSVPPPPPRTSSIPPIPRAPGLSPKARDEQEFLREMQASRERAGFVAYWEAYRIALAARVARGDSAQDAAEYADRAATIAEVDYRDKVSMMTKRIGALYGGK